MYSIKRVICRFGALSLFLLPASANAQEGGQGAFSAQQISAENIAELPREGMDAIAGKGDWWLSNGRLCAAISDIDHDAGIVVGGGSLIDLGFCDRSDDQWSYANVLTGLAKEKAIPAKVISAHNSEGRAEIRVVGEDQGLRQTLRYVLSDEHPDELELWVEVERIGRGRRVQLSGMLTLYPNRAMTPYTLSSYLPQYSLGFDHPVIDRNNVFSLVGGMMPADWNILLGSHMAQPSISYGVQLESATLTDREGRDHALPQFLVTLPEYSLHGWMTRPLWFGSDKPGLWQMAQSQLMDLKTGERMRARFRIVPGQRPDVASISDRIYRGVSLHGSVNVAPVVVEVRGADGQALSQRRVNEPGPFELVLPESIQDIEVVARSPWGETLVSDHRVNDRKPLELGALVFKERSGVSLPRGQAMKLIFYGINGTATPQLRDDLLNFRLDGELVEHSLISNNVSLAGVASDPETLYLAPGEYRVLATRGLEYGVTSTELSLRPGVMQPLTISAPERELDTDWLSADMHVHAAASFDSTLPLSEQIRAFVAQGADILVLAEHNRIVDGRGVAQQMGLADTVTVVTGSELTGMSRSAAAPTSNGHSNIFPVTYRDTLYAGGVPRVEGVRLRSLIAQTRYRYPHAVFQLNHPRSQDPLDADSAFFDHLSLATPYEPALPLTHSRNSSLLEADGATGFRDIDFDLMEVLNGADMKTYAASRRDWFSLLRQGLRIKASGNSDSHKLATPVAVPRNYLALPRAGNGFSDAEFARVIREGRMYFTNGPLMDVAVGDAGLGDTVSGASHTLSVMPRAASWVGLDTLRIFVNGELWREQKVSPDTLYSENIHLARDSVINVELTGPVTAQYRQVLPGFSPVALSNPIYVDADGDGQWLPPGVP